MPLVLLVPIPWWVKSPIILTAVIYAILVSINGTNISVKSMYQIHSFKHFYVILIRFVLLVVLTVIFMLTFHPSDLFIVAKRNVPMLIGISLFYSLFSVFPQEFFYRSYFYARYSQLFNQKRLGIFLNAVLFSFAHIAFKNLLVLAMTFIGGLVFSMSYLKTKSLMITSIEHALYGCWLFTVGMGEMLAFPMPE